MSHGFATPDGTLTMPGFAGALSSEAIWHLIDYLRAHNAGDAMRRTGSWPQPLPMPQFDAQCANGRTIDLDDLRGRALRIIAVSDDERPEPPLPDDLDAVTVLVARNLAAKPTGRRVHCNRATGLDGAGDHRRRCHRMRWPARRCWSIATAGCAPRGGPAMPRTGPIHASSLRDFATFSPIRLPSIRPRRTRTITDGRLVCPAASSGAPPAVLLRLDHPGLRLLRRVPPGRRGRHAVDLRGADDARFRLVAHRAVRAPCRWAACWQRCRRRRSAACWIAAARVSCCASRC